MHEQLKLEYLKKACQRSRIDFDATIQECREGRSQFFEVEEACAITTIAVSGLNRVLHVSIVAGTLAGVAELEPILTEFAVNEGCDAIRTVGRPGFSRVFDTLGDGWKPVATVYEKRIEDLSHGRH